MTNKLKKKKNLFLFFSLLTWIGTTTFLVIYTLIKFNKNGTVDSGETEKLITISEGFKTTLISFSTTAIIGLVLAIIIKEKARTFIWMCDVVIATIAFGSKGMFVILSIWFLDEYIITALYKHYKNRYIINKELDIRGTV